jgi:glycosyltransferase involved in cell wall biosynthesis
MDTQTIVMTSTFYPPYHIGGDAMHVKYLAEALVQNGHEVHVLHSIDAYRLKKGVRRRAMEETAVNIHQVETAVGRLSPALAYLTGRNRNAERALERMIKEERPSLIHHHNISLLGIEMLRIGRVPKLYTAHDYWLLCQRSDLMYKGKDICEQRKCLRCSFSSMRPYQYWRSRMLSGAIHGVDRIIAPSEFMAHLLESRLRVDSVVIRNFVPRLDDIGTAPAERRHFVFASVLERHKGLDLLIESFKCGRFDSELHIIGSGSLEPLVRRSEKETEGKVKHLGFIPHRDVVREIASSLCMVMPSTWYENSPLSCIEALSLGRPLVVSRMGGLPELVRDPECGIECDLTPDSLSAALKAIESDDTLRKKLSENAMAKYAKQHTQERYLSTYMKLVEEVLCNAS